MSYLQLPHAVVDLYGGAISVRINDNCGAREEVYSYIVCTQNLLLRYTGGLSAGIPLNSDAAPRPRALSTLCTAHADVSTFIDRSFHSIMQETASSSDMR